MSIRASRTAAWRRRAVGYLNQHTLIAGHLTALENAHWLGATVVASAHDPDLIEAADAVLDLGR